MILQVFMWLIYVVKPQVNEALLDLIKASECKTSPHDWTNLPDKTSSGMPLINTSKSSWSSVLLPLFYNEVLQTFNITHLFPPIYFFSTGKEQLYSFLCFRFRLDYTIDDANHHKISHKEQSIVHVQSIGKIERFLDLSVRLFCDFLRVCTKNSGKIQACKDRGCSHIMRDTSKRVRSFPYKLGIWVKHNWSRLCAVVKTAYIEERNRGPRGKLYIWGGRRRVVFCVLFSFTIVRAFYQSQHKMRENTIWYL